MHDYLLSVRHENSDPVVFRVLLETLLSLQDSCLDLFETAQINLVQNLIMDLFKVFFLELNLFHDSLKLLLKTVYLLLVYWNEAFVDNIVSQLLFISLGLILLICVLD